MVPAMALRAASNTTSTFAVHFPKPCTRHSFRDDNLNVILLSLYRILRSPRYSTFETLEEDAEEESYMTRSERMVYNNVSPNPLTLNCWLHSDFKRQLLAASWLPDGEPRHVPSPRFRCSHEYGCLGALLFPSAPFDTLSGVAVLSFSLLSVKGDSKVNDMTNLTCSDVF